MPLVQHNNLPSFERVRSEGIAVSATVDEASPSINIGFINMMPDAALAATERQFLRLVGSAEQVNCYFYPFNMPGIERSPQVQEYIDQYYSNYESLANSELDVLIITGANVSQPLLQNECFWSELVEVLNWGKSNVRSMLCSCLATHAAVKVFYDIDRQHLGDKCWGVFEHKRLSSQHDLLTGVDQTIHMCHSRFNDIPGRLFNLQDIEVLINSEQAGVQLAAEKDMSTIYFQGHPEYDDISLLKEYKREIIRFINREVSEYPPVPENYFNNQAMQFVNLYQAKILKADDKAAMLEQFPEAELKKCITDSWQATAKQIFSNWITSIVESKS